MDLAATDEDALRRERSRLMRKVFDPNRLERMALGVRLHERDRHLAFEGVSGMSGWRALMERGTASLEAALAPPDDALFTMIDFEWESGLG